MTRRAALPELDDFVAEFDVARPPPLSDDALALAFVRSEGARWRYVPAWRAWFRWTGMYWEQDPTDYVRECMRRVCRMEAVGADDREARRVASERTIRSSLALAASDPQIATDPSSWDTHPMLLNTETGVVDLQAGEVQPHDPMYLMTQIAHARIGSTCPRWLVFLDEITDGDKELAAYLQRLAGYCLTGSTSEQCFAFLHGHGANGKSVFLSTLSHVLGSYAATATLDTFAASRSARHLTELAGLRAARLVVVPETEAGQGWAEARIKTVTGGERIRANFMHKDHFEYLPQFKLLVAGNHRPSLSNVGEAMRRRLHLVPFTTTVPTDRRDHRLTEKLCLERDGILSWMLAGCVAWQIEGLSPPPCVTEAARDYFASEDLVGQWIDECCMIEGSEPSAGLFQSWKAWAEAGGFTVGTQKSLGESLRAKGFRDGKVHRARGWHGVSLRRGHPNDQTTS